MEIGKNWVFITRFLEHKTPRKPTSMYATV